MTCRALAIVVSVILLATAAFAQTAPPEGRGALHPDNVARAARAKAARERAEQRLKLAKSDFVQARAMAQKVRDQLRERTGRIDVSADSIQKAAARLEAEL